MLRAGNLSTIKLFAAGDYGWISSVAWEKESESGRAIVYVLRLGDSRLGLASVTALGLNVACLSNEPRKCLFWTCTSTSMCLGRFLA